MDDNWFDYAESGSMGLESYGFDLNPDYTPGDVENAVGSAFDWTGSDLNLSDADQQQLASYFAANPGVLDNVYGSGVMGLLNSAGNTLSGALQGAGSFLGGLSPSAWGAGAMIASGLISGKEAEALMAQQQSNQKELAAQQQSNQKELLQYKHDLDKPTAWVAPSRGLLHLR